VSVGPGRADDDEPVDRRIPFGKKPLEISWWSTIL
jgi:hypothetical protein